MKKSKRYVIGVDPSGNFVEGKGHTGLAVYDTVNDCVTETGYVYAGDFKTWHEYYRAVWDTIRELYRDYGLNAVVSIEDYQLYGHKAKDQINSKLETPRLIGYLLMMFVGFSIKYYIRPAVRVKTRWTEDVLCEYGYIAHPQKGLKSAWVLPSTSKVLLTHELDAIKHAVHCGKFELEDAEDVLPD